LFTESALCEDDLLELKIHFFGPVFRFVCNANFTSLVQYLVSVCDAKSTCSAQCLAPVDEFCRSLTVSNEQIHSVKILIYDKLPVFTCDAGISPLLAVGESGFFHWRFSVFLLGPARRVSECHNHSRLPPPKAAFIKLFVANQQNTVSTYTDHGDQTNIYESCSPVLQDTPVTNFPFIVQIYFL